MDEGVEIYAASDGVVIYTGDEHYDRWSNENLNVFDVDSNVVEILHPDGTMREYCHFKRNSITVEVGDQVSAGQTIGLVGSSGNSTEPHLHFGVLDANYDYVVTYADSSTWWYWWVESVDSNFQIVHLIGKKLISSRSA